KPRAASTASSTGGFSCRSNQPISAPGASDTSSSGDLHQRASIHFGNRASSGGRKYSGRTPITIDPPYPFVSSKVEARDPGRLRLKLPLPAERIAVHHLDAVGGKLVAQPIGHRKILDRSRFVAHRDGGFNVSLGDYRFLWPK